MPSVGPFATREYLIGAARHAEALGFDSVWITDHVVLPVENRSEYPYPESGVPFAVYQAGVDWLDPIVALGIIAGATERVQLASSVCVLPYRNPLVLANETATLDRLSDGRLLFGVGAGWIEEEFAAVGVPFSERGPRTDESIEIIRTLWTQQNAEYTGRFWSFRNVSLATHPVQKPSPPILVGGNHGPALRRAGRLGDGWHGMDVKLDETPAKVASLREHAEKAGRDPNALTPTVRRGVRPAEYEADFTPERICLGPEADDVAREIDAYEKAGVQHICLDFSFPPEESARKMEWFAREVMPLLG